MVRTLRDAIILSQLSERPSTREELANRLDLGKIHVTDSIRNMKKSGLVKGRGYYMLTTKGRNHFQSACKRISKL